MSGIAPRGPGSNLQTNNPFGNINNVNSLFGGNASASNPFGTATTNTSPFGNALNAQHKTPNTPPTAEFGVTNPFASSAPSASTNPFATALGTSPFTANKQAAATPTPFSGGGLFAAAAAPANHFGAVQTSTFGNVSSVSVSPTGTVPTQTINAGTTGLFGTQVNTASGGLFGNLSNSLNSTTPTASVRVASTTSAPPPQSQSPLGTNLFGQLTTNTPLVADVPQSQSSIREVERVENKLVKKLLEMTREELSKLRISERTMRDERNCQLVYSQAKWKAGYIPELPPPQM